jgi:type IV pilus assembly protein PilY1
MNIHAFGKLRSLCTGLLLTLAAGAALADDTEIFFNTNVNGANANVMFILDTSGSMNDVVTSQVAYDSTQTYTADRCAGNFATDRVYYGTGGTLPSCGSTNYILNTSFKCVDASAVLASGAGTATAGYYAGSALIQWGPITVNTGTRRRPILTTVYEWQPSLGITNGTDVECRNDNGVAGRGTLGDSKPYPSKAADNSSTTGIWDSNAANSWWSVSGNTGGSYVIYSGNYLNWSYNSAANVTNTKVAVLQDAMTSILNSATNINVGLMRYDARGAGGMVQNAIAPIASNRAPILANVNANAPTGTTPISESLFEAFRYFSGGAVDFGQTSTTSRCNAWTTSGGLKTCSSLTTSSFPSVAASRAGGAAGASNYASPAQLSCQKNFIVFLTDGLPNSDYKADTNIKALPNYATTTSKCYTSTSAMYTALGNGGAAPTGTDGSGLCSAAIAQYMNRNDMTNSVAGVQNVTTFFIGFGNDFADSSGAPTASFSYLQDIAAKGGGKAYTATNLGDLTSAFSEILASVIKTNTTFTAPAVSVNAFNRTQSLNDLYVSVFSPKAQYHWPGNMKHYKVVGGQVVDADGVAAVDPATGFFKATARSIWSAAADGFDVTKGGLAENLPAPVTRNVYTYIGTNPVGNTTPINLATSSSTQFATTNALITNAVLSIGGTGDPTRSDLIAWARGQDVPATTPRNEVGDPVHTAPAVVIYGKNPDGSDRTVAFVATNDGYLHAADAATGVELWSFVPQEMLVHLVDLFQDPDTTVKHYGIDGPITVLKYDINNDGTVDAAAGDKVILYFGTGRNADVNVYYALDVTDPTQPLLRWAIDGSVLPGLGQAWSQPVLTRVRVSGATQNSQKLALVMGGGYDQAEDGYNYLDYSAAAVKERGAHVFIVDALYGTKLWSAGAAAPDDFVNTRMDHAIPSTVAVMDLDSDGYMDRMYVGDTAAQLWRFDVTNGNPASTLVAGGVIASLGTREDATKRAVATRRFYSAPDVALIRTPGKSPFINIAIGSGYRGHPLDKTVRDRFYSVRDLISPLATMTQANFDSITATGLIRDAEIASTRSLVDITSTVTPTMPAGAPGWQLVLNPGASATGEKSLSPSNTFNNSVIFTTYSPTASAGVDPCAGVGSGTNRVYVVSVTDGSPVVDQNKDGTVTTADRGYDLAQSGIAPQAQFLFLPKDANQPNNNQDTSNVTCLSGVEVLNVCGSFNQRIKTYWREGQAN